MINGGAGNIAGSQSFLGLRGGLFLALIRALVHGFSLADLLGQSLAVQRDTGLRFVILNKIRK